MSKRISLGEAISFKNGKTPPARSNILKYPVFGANGIIGHSSEINSNGPCIVIGRVGAYCGSLHYSSTPCWVTDNAIIAEPKNQNESRYWFYALKTLDLHNRSQGSGQPLINQEILRSITFGPCTPREMSTISTILGALDDKIAANQSVIDLADKLLLTKFKLLSQSTSETTSLREVLGLKYGKSLPKKNRVPGEALVVGSGGVSGTHNVELISGPSVILGRKGTVGATYWIDGPAFPIDTTFWVDSINTPLIYTYYLLRTIDFASMSVDSAVPGLNRERAYDETVPNPSIGAIEDFCREAEEVSALMTAVKRESRALAATRDELLPLLMSGKITVRDAEKRVEKEV